MIVDAGVGNLGNLRRALAALGWEGVITREPATVARAGCLLLPGVGAFRPPRERLREELEEALAAALSAGAHLLGICVGFQLLFEAGEEHGECDGLGLLPGRVRRLPATVPLPHIGWNRLREMADHPLLDGIPEGAYVYFVHSYAPEGVPREAVLASALHGRSFPAVVGPAVVGPAVVGPAVVSGGRVFGTQFHPEKSGRVGLALLANFLEMSRGAAAVH